MGPARHYLFLLPMYRGERWIQLEQGPTPMRRKAGTARVRRRAGAVPVRRSAEGRGKPRSLLEDLGAWPRPNGNGVWRKNLGAHVNFRALLDHVFLP